MSPWSNGPYTLAREGYLIHGSRSGVAANDAVQEFWGTAHFTKTRQDGLAYQATIGPNLVSWGLPLGQWGWHARGCSERWVGFELAQAVEAHPIDDDTVNALCWAIQQDQDAWRSIGQPPTPLVFLTHADAQHTAEYGNYADGKSDVFSSGSPHWDDLEARIITRLGALGLV